MDIILIALYLACELTANVTASKPVAVGGVVVPAGVFIYALTFISMSVKKNTFIFQKFFPRTKLMAHSMPSSGGRRNIKSRSI